MGNVCCGGAEEKKASALSLEGASEDVTTAERQTLLSSDQHAETSNSHHGSGGLLPQQALLTGEPSSSAAAPMAVSAAEQKAAEERFREEQARLELIVQATGRGMVPVRSQRGSTGYYDQGFAAALAQHLEQTTQFPEMLEQALPPPPPPPVSGSSSSSSVYARLAQPEWEGIALGNKDGENPVTYMDHIAELCLDAAIPKKERLFANVEPIMENLL